MKNYMNLHGVRIKVKKKEEEKNPEDIEEKPDREDRSSDKKEKKGKEGKSTAPNESGERRVTGGNNGPINPSSVHQEDKNEKIEKEEDPEDLDAQEDKKDIEIIDLDSFAERHPYWAKIPFLAKIMDNRGKRVKKAGEREKTEGAKKKSWIQKRRERVKEFKEKYFRQHMEYPRGDQTFMVFIGLGFLPQFASVLNQPVKENLETEEIASETKKVSEDKYKGTQAEELAKKMEVKQEDEIDKSSERNKDNEHIKTTKERMAEFKGGMKPPTQKKGILPYGINREDSKNAEKQDNFVTRMMSAGYNKVNGIDPANNSHEENNEGLR